MKKSVLFLCLIMSICMLFSIAAAQSTENVPVFDPQMNGQQMPDQIGHMPGNMNRFPMNGQEPMKMMSIGSETADLLSAADPDADVISQLANGTVIRVLEEAGNYVKVDNMGTEGYILKEDLSEELPEMPAKPEDGKSLPYMPGSGEQSQFGPENGQFPPAMPQNGEQPQGGPENGQLPPAMPQNGEQPQGGPENGQLPPAMPQNGEQPQGGSENGQLPPAMPQNGEQPQAKPDDGQVPPAMPQNGEQPQFKPEDGQMTSHTESVNHVADNMEQSTNEEPGIGSFFRSFFRLLTGNRSMKNQKTN